MAGVGPQQGKIPDIHDVVAVEVGASIESCVAGRRAECNPHDVEIEYIDQVVVVSVPNQKRAEINRVRPYLQSSVG